MLDEREMRQVYTAKMIELAKRDESICLLEADLMKSTGTSDFFNTFPERSIDVGIAESNMVGVAAGLAACGKKPFCASFTPFITRRCFDQIAISVCYSKLNVKLVGTDPSVMAEVNGGTHMSMEDVGIMRGLANMVIFEPIDATMLDKSLEDVVNYNGPLYMRLFRKKAEKVFDDRLKFDLFKGNTLSEGKDCMIIASGIMVAKAVEAVKILKTQGINAGVLAIHTIKPIDKESVIKAAEYAGAIVTCENHSIINGLGSAVAEVLSENCPTPLKRLGVNDRFGEVGRLPYLLETFKLTENDICNAVKDCIALKNKRK